ncbi:ethanolamine ammonia-lyase reactivating factor EutA [Klebsiella pneumoniae]|nr:ethanolamine ammonia-lyase reactivating factor EutA [Klebsiella pneumoniae]
MKTYRRLPTTKRRRTRGTRQLLSVGDIGTTTTRVIFSRTELVNRAAVSRNCRVMNASNATLAGKARSSLRRLISRRTEEAELEALILAQYRAAGIAPQAVDSGAIIITGSAKTRNARPAVIWRSQSLGDFVVAAPGPHLESVIAGRRQAQTLSRQRMCRVLNIDIGGGTSRTMPLFDARKRQRHRLPQRRRPPGANRRSGARGPRAPARATWLFDALFGAGF